MTTSQNTPAIFSNPALFSGNLRVIMQGDDPWFVAKDVCDALGLLVGNSVRHLDDDEKITLPNKQGNPRAGIPHNYVIINESGLYSLILRSRKPEALRFKKWITSEVLPSIRKTGGYIVARPDESPEVILARAVLVAQDTIERMKAKAAALEAEVKELAPKAAKYEAVLDSTGTITITDAGKLLGMTGRQLGAELREMGWLFKRTDARKPTDDPA